MSAASLICDLARQFYDLGWVSGTGGGISVRVNDRVYMAPSGVQKELLTPETIFTLDMNGDVVAAPADAKLYFDGVQTRTTSDRREFVSPVLSPGMDYHYTVKAIDQAGNSASKTIAATAPGALFAPMPGERVSTRPVLSWMPVKGAQYYNVQLVRGKKILSAWPGTNHFRVPRSWVYQGHRYRLHRGVYRWYIWPGFGTFSASKYGSVLGGSSFVFSSG